MRILQPVKWIVLLSAVCAGWLPAAERAAQADGGTGAASRATRELQMLGISTVHYPDTEDNTSRIKQVEVRNNRTSGVSGELAIQVWLFFDRFAGQGGQTGYKVAELSLGTLAAGSSKRNNDSGVVPGLTIPADGTYYASFLLVETIGTQTFWYDYRNFDGSVVYTNGLVDVDAPPAVQAASSATARQGAPFSFIFSSDGALPITHTASGLPAGLALKNAESNIDNSGIYYPTISGTPTQAGSFAITLKATNSDGDATATLNLTVSPKTDDAPPTVASISATPRPAQVGQRVTFTAAATDPENAVPTYTWDFKDGTTDTGDSVSHTYSAAGTYVVEVAVSDGANTVTRTISLEVKSASTLDPVVDGVSTDANPVAIATTVTFTATASSPANETLSYSWNFGDDTGLKTGNPATHAYTQKGEYTVSLTVTDVSNRLTVFSDLTMFVTDSTDTSPGGKPAKSPDGVEITVLPAPHGVVALGVGVVTPRGMAPREDYDFGTEFYLPGRASHPFASGSRPNGRLDRSGVLVATSTATPHTNKNNRLRGRKTIPLSAVDAGGQPTVPDTLTDSQKGIQTTKLTGTFNFTSDKSDSVSVSCVVRLPEGYDLMRSQELSMAVGNVTDRIVLNAKGRATGLSDRGLMKKVAIKYPRGVNGLTQAGQTAKIDMTLSGPNLDEAGFESDGVSFGASGPGQKTAPTLQVGIVLAGIAYSDEIPATMTVSSKGDKAAVKLTK